MKKKKKNLFIFLMNGRMLNNPFGSRCNFIYASKLQMFLAIREYKKFFMFDNFT